MAIMSTVMHAPGCQPTATMAVYECGVGWGHLHHSSGDQFLCAGLPHPGKGGRVCSAVGAVGCQIGCWAVSNGGSHPRGPLRVDGRYGQSVRAFARTLPAFRFVGDVEHRLSGEGSSTGLLRSSPGKGVVPRRGCTRVVKCAALDPEVAVGDCSLDRSTRWNKGR